MATTDDLKAGLRRIYSCPLPADADADQAQREEAPLNLRELRMYQLVRAAVVERVEKRMGDFAFAIENNAPLINGVDLNDRVVRAVDHLIHEQIRKVCQHKTQYRHLEGAPWHQRIVQVVEGRLDALSNSSDLPERVDAILAEELESHFTSLARRHLDQRLAMLVEEQMHDLISTAYREVDDAFRQADDQPGA